jgi:tRNA dimethylallyltransferase
MTQTRPNNFAIGIYGPTSAGKTRLSVDLCLRLRDELGVNPVVISADSRQVYRNMDIGTSKTTREEMAGVRHEMIDVADPDQKLELESFVRMARRHMESCWSAGQTPVIVGGTSVYIRSLLEGWEVDSVADARRSLRKDFPRGMIVDAWEVLTRVDPKAARRVGRTDYDGVINALSHAMADRNDAPPPIPAIRSIVLGVDLPARLIDQRVAKTFARQLRHGLLEEVRSLEERYGLLDQLRRLGRQAPNQVLHTHGYAEWFEAADTLRKSLDRLTPGDKSAIEKRVVERIIRHTRRQRSGFRKLANVVMVRNAEDAFVTTSGVCRPSLPSCRS